MIQFNANSLTRNNSYTTMLKKEKIMDLLKNHMTLDEINRNPTLSSALYNNKALKFSLLTSKENNIFPSLIKNQKKQKLINSINTFRKAYFDYNKNVKVSTDEINNISRQSNQFIKNYNNILLKTGMTKKNVFSDIKAEYEKQNYNLPNLNDGENIFKSSLLLSNNDTDLKKYIIYGHGSKSGNEKSVEYLKKLDEELNDEQDAIQKINFTLFSKLNSNLKFRKREYYNPLYNKIPRAKIKELLTYRRDIKKVQKTIDSIQDIDYFFNSDNKEYLNTLKFFYSRNSSANCSTSLGNNNSTFFDKKNATNKSNILSFRNISKYTLDEKENNKNKNDKNKIKINIGANTANFFSGNIGKENNPPKLYNVSKKKKIIKRKKLKKIDYHKTLETLYNKISSASDTTIYNKKIRNFLKYRKYKLNSDISKNYICNNMESLREKFKKDNSIKKVIYFRQSVSNIYNGKKKTNIENEPEIEKKIYDIEDQMINAFTEKKN